MILVKKEGGEARFKALHAFNSLREFNCSRATFNALWAFNSALHVQKFFQSPMADILQITFKIKQGNGCVSKVLQTKTAREVVNDKLVCRYNSLSAIDVKKTSHHFYFCKIMYQIM